MITFKATEFAAVGPIVLAQEKYFPLRVDPFLEGFGHPGKPTGSHKKDTPFKKLTEKNGGTLIHHKPCKRHTPV